MLEGDAGIWAAVSGGRLTAPTLQPSSLAFTSRMKNLAVFTLAQVFFSLETGLMFMPAARGSLSWGTARAAQSLSWPRTGGSVQPQLAQTFRLHAEHSDVGWGCWCTLCPGGLASVFVGSCPSARHTAP